MSMGVYTGLSPFDFIRKHFTGIAPQPLFNN
jgi:hypothetical protein